MAGSDAWGARLTDEPIDPAQVLARVGSPAHGAVLLFLGTVRNHADGRGVRGLRYEAYGSMAQDVLEALTKEAAQALDGGRVYAVHRVGNLEVGEVSVAVAVSSPHRAQAFEVGRNFMDELKVRLPVWKHERYADGDADWVDGSRIQPPTERPTERPDEPPIERPVERHVEPPTEP